MFINAMLIVAGVLLGHLTLLGKSKYDSEIK